MRHRLQCFIHLRAHGLRKGDKHPAYTPRGAHFILPMNQTLDEGPDSSREGTLWGKPVPSATETYRFSGGWEQRSGGGAAGCLHHYCSSLLLLQSDLTHVLLTAEIDSRGTVCDAEQRERRHQQLLQQQRSRHHLPVLSSHHRWPRGLQHQPRCVVVDTDSRRHADRLTSAVSQHNALSLVHGTWTELSWSSRTGVLNARIPLGLSTLESANCSCLCAVNSPGCLELAFSSVQFVRCRQPFKSRSQHVN